MRMSASGDTGKVQKQEAIVKGVGRTIPIEKIDPRSGNFHQNFLIMIDVELNMLNISRNPPIIISIQEQWI